MSKFIDRLNQLSWTASQPLGFGARQASADKPKLQLVAGLAQDDVESLVGRLNGADAALLRLSRVSAGNEALQKVARAIPDLICGAWLSGCRQEEVDEITGLEADFLVYPASSTPLAIPGDTKAGKVLAVESSLSEGLLMAVNRLPVDAVLVTAEPGDDYLLTWQHLVFFGRFSTMLTKPVLVSIPSRVTGGDLQALWTAGISGVVVDVVAGQPEDRLSELRRLIDKLVVLLPHRDKKTEAVLPPTGGELGKVVIEEE